MYSYTKQCHHTYAYKPQDGYQVPQTLQPLHNDPYRIHRTHPHPRLVVSHRRPAARRLFEQPRKEASLCIANMALEAAYRSRPNGREPRSGSGASAGEETPQMGRIRTFAMTPTRRSREDQRTATSPLPKTGPAAPNIRRRLGRRRRTDTAPDREIHHHRLRSPGSVQQNSPWLLVGAAPDSERTGKSRTTPYSTRRHLLRHGDSAGDTHP